MTTIYTDNWAVNPTPVDREISLNDSVKISNGREKFFAIVSKLESDGWMVGEVANQLVHDVPYKREDLVRFHRCHVLFWRSAEEREKMLREIPSWQYDYAKRYYETFHRIHGRLPTMDEWLTHWERTQNMRALPRGR